MHSKTTRSDFFENVFGLKSAVDVEEPRVPATEKLPRVRVMTSPGSRRAPSRRAATPSGARATQIRRLRIPTRAARFKAGRCAPAAPLADRDLHDQDPIPPVHQVLQLATRLSKRRGLSPSRAAAWCRTGRRTTVRERCCGRRRRVCLLGHQRSRHAPGHGRHRRRGQLRHDDVRGERQHHGAVGHRRPRLVSHVPGHADSSMHRGGLGEPSPPCRGGPPSSASREC